MRALRILLIVLALGFVVWQGTRKNTTPAPGPEVARQAQKPSDCVFDNCTPAPVPASPAGQATPAPDIQAAAPGPGGPIAPGNFDFYVLSLSWSPGFCETNPAGSGKSQCAAGSGLGFVVHGLWPQFERGFPSDCSVAQPVSQSALALTRGVFPDPGLARYEWGKHGTCSGLAPEAYFTDVRRARDSITIPDAFKGPVAEQSLGPNELMRAFTEANQRLRPGMMAVGCKGGVLEEVRFCLTKDLRGFRTCPEVTQQSCHSRQVRVPPVL